MDEYLLLTELLREPAQERRRRIWNEESFHSPRICELLEERSREAWFSDPAAALEMADLAVTAAECLDPGRYGSSWVEEARAMASLEDSALTHFDPRCQLACAAFNGAIARALNQVKPLSPDDLVDGALSDVAYTITVTDLTTGAVKAYTNPQGHLASFADTSAF